MFKYSVNPAHLSWSSYEKILFRIIFIYFFLQIFPLDWKYYRHLSELIWLEISFKELFHVAKYTPQFTSDYQTQDWGLATFTDWGIIFIIALIGALIWSLTDKTRKNYQALYSWLRVLVRYRLAIAVIAYGFLKLFSIQAPQPSISSLNTPYGDFTTWKLFSLSLGIVPGYQAFLGAVELLAGILLLFRKTTVIGATIIIFFTGNVFMSNLAYEGGEVVYSFFLVTLALFLVAYDLQRIISLIILAKPTAPARSGFSWTRQQLVVRLALKSLIVLFFVIIYGFSAKRTAAKGGYHFTENPPISGWSGLYRVTRFSIDGQDHPYNVADTLRWQNVVFEKWATLSIKINKNFIVYNDYVETVPLPHERSDFEFAGTTGRKYYNYQADTVQHTLKLQDQEQERINTGQQPGGPHAEPLTSPHFKITDDQLSYGLNPDATITLSGKVDGRNIVAVLEKDNKKYLIKAVKKGRRSGLKL